MFKAFIDDLGGTRRVSEVLGVKHGAVRMWLTPGRSIPWKHRHALARLAADQAVDLPDGYWAAEAA